MNHVKERTFGELGVSNRGIFIVSDYWKPAYAEIIKTLFGNTIPPKVDGENSNFSSLLATDPAGCLFFGEEASGGAQKLRQRRDEIRAGFSESGPYEKLLMCVHAARKRYKRDALHILERSTEIFSPTNQLLIVDSETHAQSDWGSEAEGVDVFLERVHARTDMASLSILHLGMASELEAQKMIAQKIREVVSA